MAAVRYDRDPGGRGFASAVQLFEHDVTVAPEIGHAHAGLDCGARQTEVHEVRYRGQERIDPVLTQKAGDVRRVGGIELHRAGDIRARQPVEALGGALRLRPLDVGHEDHLGLAETIQVVSGSRPLSARSEDGVAVTHSVSSRSPGFGRVQCEIRQRIGGLCLSPKRGGAALYSKRMIVWISLVSPRIQVIIDRSEKV